MTTPAEFMQSMQRRIAAVETATHVIPHGRDVYSDDEIAAIGADPLDVDEVELAEPDPAEASTEAPQPMEPSSDEGESGTTGIA